MNGPTRGPEATAAAVHDAGLAFAEMMLALARGYAEAVSANDHHGAERILRHAFALANAWDHGNGAP